MRKDDKCFSIQRQLPTKEGFKVIIVWAELLLRSSQNGLETKNQKISHLQAAAAVGQVSLVEAYEKEFRKNGLTTAQVLITGEDLVPGKDI